MHGLWPVGHRRRRRMPIQTCDQWLTAWFPLPLSPNMFVICKNFINKNCRATRGLQLWFIKFPLICHGFQNAKLQSMVHQNWKSVHDLANFSKLKTICWFLLALFDHVRHWISSWPKNKSCYSSQVLQLCLRVHYHANTLCYSSTLVKVGSWKLEFLE